MTFKQGKFKVRITVRKDGTLVIEIEPWERKGGLTPPAPTFHFNSLEEATVLLTLLL